MPFRAAEVRNILEFPQAFEPAARVIALAQNYRSTPEILNAANAVLAEAEEGYAKALWGQPAQRGQAGARYRARRQWSGRLYLPRNPGRSGGGIDLQQQAVLFRSAFHSAGLEVELTRRNIPFVKYGGLKFLDAARIKDVLACLRLAQDPERPHRRHPHPAAAAGYWPLDRRSAGPGDVRGAEPARALEEASVPARAAADWPAFVALYGGLRSDAPAWPAQLEGGQGMV